MGEFYDENIIKFFVSYDGSSFYGWQKTRAGPSIQYHLESALSTLLQTNIAVTGASRTDRGVHAFAQVCHTKIPKTSLSLGQILYKINCLLPKDIRVFHIEYAKNFHATHDAVAKTYVYHIKTAPWACPLENPYYYHFPKKVCCSLMQEGAQYMQKRQDFALFANRKKDVVLSHTTMMHSILIKSFDEKIFIVMKGQKFFYKMARNIAGFLLQVGSGKLSLDAMKELLHQSQKPKMGMTLPAHGLFLLKVDY